MIFLVDDIIVSTDIITEFFCCDLDVCKGACCVEGDDGAPVTMDEVMSMEDALPVVEDMLADKAKHVIETQGVVYPDRDGQFVTSIRDGRDCCFAFHEGGCALCAFEKAFREHRSTFKKPISCSLYPIREKHLKNNITALDYHRWDICRSAVENGKRRNIRVFEFLRGPLTERFGEAWYDDLVKAAEEIRTS
jgi:hypothetical protein